MEQEPRGEVRIYRRTRGALDAQPAAEAWAASARFLGFAPILYPIKIVFLYKTYYCLYKK